MLFPIKTFKTYKISSIKQWACILQKSLSIKGKEWLGNILRLLAIQVILLSALRSMGIQSALNTQWGNSQPMRDESWWINTPSSILRETILESSDWNPQKLPEVPSPSPVIQSKSQLKMQLGISFSSLFPSYSAPHQAPALKPLSQALLSERYQAEILTRGVTWKTETSLMLSLLCV